jgi:endoglucanase
MEIKELIVALCGLMSVSGWETYERSKLLSIVGGCFDECRADSVGNQIFVKRCGKPGAPRILIDTHMDEIGMYVTEIKKGGFLSFINVGGLDTRILQAGEVVIYGDKKIYGVIASTPPHLQKPDESKTLKEISELVIDTGYSKEELEKFVRVGTPVGFKPKYTELLGGSIAGKSFDDKACAACAIHAVAGCSSDMLAGDVFVTLSVHEETLRVSGAAAGTFEIGPDYAMTVDVNHAKAPDATRSDTIVFGGGPGVTVSAITDRRLTRMTIALAEELGIKSQISVSASSTGTNAPAVNLTGSGVPVVDIGLPLKSMHTYNEVINIADCIETSKLIAGFICSRKIAEAFAG